ncbi:nicotinic acid mononucleotide adenyltransferase [Robiginitalea sp. M366]|uniref:nicotinic acid mononucleotide adenyltransferase n=1 Tax=Robiginitalea aestuariiviva TaxID=3036903 RepID=UPI00240E5927|nr:nicotinic acid mononucleotide adenyltransferase [Robiginitalea aestuariiviva]MDG1571646.1 nicotinic acid mononucleotide adenyltransferase [Robiginitalea aestuariiviva]
MKTTLVMLPVLLLALASCTAEIWIEDDYVAETPWQTQDALEAYDLWYVDVNATRGLGEIPFLQAAFTLSFDRGVLKANNNLVGIGKTGYGLGIPVGTYAPLRGVVSIAHDLDGLWELEVFVEGPNVISLYHAPTDTSYVLRGYSRAGFDYDALFYDNIHYFLQEYEAWEKVETSLEGVPNAFDQEQWLQFLPDGQGDFFRSSTDPAGLSLSQLVWDYTGGYQVFDVPGNPDMKTLTLDYDYMGNEYFELYVIDDAAIALYHPESETLYQFRGRGFQTILKDSGLARKKRIARKLPLMDVERQWPRG